MYKLTEFQCPLYIWHLLNKWYSQSTSAVLWNSCISRAFCVQQGVHEGAILSPLLYSIFVNSLLDSVLRTVSPSSVLRTIERCSSGCSAINAVGSRFGCLHLSTSFRLYSSFCLPILLYGCELWCLTGSEIIMLERVHRKILRTIQGLPLHCHSKALQFLMGIPSIQSLIQQRQLIFTHSFSLLPSDSTSSDF